MLIRDMHIAVQLKLNKVNSFLYDTLTSQEVDYFLNIAIERFVKQRYGVKSNLKQEGAEMTQKRIDDLRALLVSYYEDRAYVVPGEDSDKVRFSFPADYLFLMSNRAKVAYDVCGRPITSTLRTETFTYYPIPLFNYATGNIGEYAGDYFDIVDDTATSIGTYSAPSQYLIPEDIGSQFVNYVVANTTGGDYKCYWQQYKTLYIPNNFIIVYTGTGTPSADMTVTWDSSNTTGPVTAQTLTLSYHKPTGSFSRMVRPTKFFQQDDIYVAFMDPFNTYSAWGPPSIITENYLDVFFDNKYVVEGVAISYFRKPAIVSLNNNVSCDLAEHTHEEIVDLAVQVLLETLESPRFGTQKDIVNTDE